MKLKGHSKLQTVLVHKVFKLCLKCGGLKGSDPKSETSYKGDLWQELRDQITRVNLC